jgi:hypothetical protein
MRKMIGENWDMEEEEEEEEEGVIKVKRVTYSTDG